MSLWKNFFTRNSVLELDHVTNVTIVLNENAASDWVLAPQMFTHCTLSFLLWWVANIQSNRVEDLNLVPIVIGGFRTFCY